MFNKTKNLQSRQNRVEFPSYWIVLGWMEIDGNRIQALLSSSYGLTSCSKPKLAGPQRAKFLLNRLFCQTVTKTERSSVQDFSKLSVFWCGYSLSKSLDMGLSMVCNKKPLRATETPIDSRTSCLQTWLPCVPTKLSGWRTKFVSLGLDHKGTLHACLFIFQLVSWCLVFGFSILQVWISLHVQQTIDPLGIFPKTTKNCVLSKSPSSIESWQQTEQQDGSEAPQTSSKQTMHLILHLKNRLCMESVFEWRSIKARGCSRLYGKEVREAARPTNHSRPLRIPTSNKTHRNLVPRFPTRFPINSRFRVSGFKFPTRFRIGASRFPTGFPIGSQCRVLGLRFPTKFRYRALELRLLTGFR